ncbi:MAG: histidine--tRNA ligase [Candidatus Hydrogenedentota bacterium]|nr:MAG: histidine--tRNA ligase [Candidatus Hydrogenedentota bacterium]
MMRSKAEQLKAPRGTRDLVGPLQDLFEKIEASGRRAAEAAGYRRISTPIFENAALFVRSVGEETDVVGKEMYLLQDRKGRRLALRPEGTAPVVRAFIERNLASAGLPVRLYYLGPMFRYERPQGGRYRQFHQFGCELFGSSSPAADFEVVGVARRFLEDLGVASHLVLNHLGCPRCKEAFARSLADFAKTISDRLCPDCRRRAERNPLRLLDCKVPDCRDLHSLAPEMELCEACSANAASIKNALREAGIEFSWDSRLVRGLDYYTGVVFEFRSADLGAQDAVLGGGRYDELVEALGGPSTPAVGFAAGIDRLALLLERTSSSPLRPFVVILPMEERQTLAAAELADGLRAAARKELPKHCSDREPVILSALRARRLKTALAEAAEAGARFVVILGENEMARGSVTVKNLDTREQWSVSVEDYSRAGGTNLAHFLREHSVPRKKAEQETISGGKD